MVIRSLNEKAVGEKTVDEKAIQQTTAKGSATLLNVLTTQRFELDQRRRESAHPELWVLLDGVKDPEIPVISIWELGVLQDVHVTEANNEVTVVITPTYSGCPALQQMRQDIRHVLSSAGHQSVQVDTQLTPAWTTEWLSPATRQKLVNYGVAAPGQSICPQCGSHNVELISEFAATACKALFRCKACQEPFDQFKSLL